MMRKFSYKCLKLRSTGVHFYQRLSSCNLSLWVNFGEFNYMTLRMHNWIQMPQLTQTESPNTTVPYGPYKLRMLRNKKVTPYTSRTIPRTVDEFLGKQLYTVGTLRSPRTATKMIFGMDDMVKLFWLLIRNKSNNPLKMYEKIIRKWHIEHQEHAINNNMQRSSHCWNDDVTNFFCDVQIFSIWCGSSSSSILTSCLRWLKRSMK